MPTNPIRPTGEGSPSLRHRFYLADRAKRLSNLFDAVKSDQQLRTDLVKNPVAVGKKYGVTFSDEEIFMVKHIQGADVDTFLRSMAAEGFWDNNCGCGGGGGGTASW